MEQGGARALCAGNRPARRHQWRHDLALALQGREPPLVLSARLPTSLRRPHLSSTLYQPCWEGHPLHDNDLVISAARRRPFRGRRTHASAPARPRRANARRTTNANAAGPVGLLRSPRRAPRPRGPTLWSPNTGITLFRRLVERVMATVPYRQARRVFWIVDNDSLAPCPRSIQPAATWGPRLRLVRTPCHAS